MTDINRQAPAGGETDAADEPYDPKFYDAIRSGSLRSAQAVVPLVLELMKPNAVIDVGCGDGTWLSVFREFGVRETLGLDGEYVDKRILRIPQDQFQPTDLALPFGVSRRFDLAVSLEVAEHLPPESAEQFVESLTKTAPVLLFSAAIPFQLGARHLNEQWPDYWAALFERRGYLAIDCIRPKIWDNDDVEWWYRQNCFIYATRSYIETHPIFREAYERTNSHQLRLVHPEKYVSAANPPQPTVRVACSILGRSIKRWVAGSILGRSIKWSLQRRVLGAGRRRRK